MALDRQTAWWVTRRPACAVMQTSTARAANPPYRLPRLLLDLVGLNLLLGGALLAPLQQYAAFHVVGEGKLVEQRATHDFMGVVQLRDVFRQGLGVAGDV